MALSCVAVQNYHHDLRSNLKIIVSFALYFFGSCFYTVLRNLDMDSFTALTFLGPFSDHNCSENIWKGKMELGNCIAPDVFDTDLESSFHFIFFRKLFLYCPLESEYGFFYNTDDIPWTFGISYRMGKWI